MSNDERPGIDHLTVGDRVIVLLPTHAKNVRREEAVITSQKRIWWTLEKDEGKDFRPTVWRARGDNQSVEAPYRNSRFVTPEQEAWDERERLAEEYLKEQKIEVWQSFRWRTDRLTLANLIRRYEGEEEF